ncbi:Pre-mRNA-processing factor 40 A like [Actinidia chinensis var. chinensis]|uniref:Pre-mRNA-processing factor 40 A like n=1 Tax=Actinidia chinensis var. chinensis TaxID=1590841 RepID=A0A2R6QV76_ACTCC|nr:Pre-mRNA-processing factor 40 A like [Actinidia chinensis var. chinensis]
MTKVSIIVAFTLAFVAAAFSAAATVSAQDFAMAPAPSPDAGSAFSLPVSVAFAGFSLFISLLSLLRQ